MIKKIYILLITVIIFGCENENLSLKTENNNDFVQNEILLPDAIRDLPVELDVKNEPDIIKATENKNDTIKYAWKLQTYVKSLSDEDITITEFGDYELLNDSTWKLHNYSGKPFTSEQFSAWYFKVKNNEFTWENSEDAVIHPNETYVDMGNWTNKSDTLVYQKGIWYFIGQKPDGSKVMGYSFYENLPELVNSHD
ncbi:MAG: hypothetical protein Kow0068_07660 [Marinilabiliales bacterium]